MNGLQGFWLHHHNHCYALTWSSSWLWNYDCFWLPLDCHCMTAYFTGSIALGKVWEVSDYTTMISTDAQVMKLTLVVKLWVM